MLWRGIFDIGNCRWGKIKGSSQCRQLRFLIHDHIAKLEELYGSNWFCKHIRRVVIGINERHIQLELFHHITYVEVTTRNMFGFLVELRIVREIMGPFIIRRGVGGTINIVFIDAS